MTDKLAPSLPAVEALRELIAKWRLADSPLASGVIWASDCADDLEALLREAVIDAIASPPHREETNVDVIARHVLELSAVVKPEKRNPSLIALAQAVLDRQGTRVEDYRSGYSAGWSHGKAGEPMQDLESAERFFNRPVASPRGGPAQ